MGVNLVHIGGGVWVGVDVDVGVGVGVGVGGVRHGSYIGWRWCWWTGGST